MKILQVITSLRTGGAERLMVDSIPIYQEKGVEMDLLLLKNEQSGFRQELEKKSRNKIFALTTGSVYNPFLIFKIIPLLRKYDIIHVHLFPAIYWVVFAKVFSRNKTPLVYTEHSTNNKRRGHPLFNLIEKFIYSKIGFIGCISNGTKIELVKHIGSDNNIEVINNGINLGRFKNLNIDPRYHNLFFENGSKILIQVSSFREQKDQKTVIESMKYLPENIKLLLVGAGPQKDQMISFANEINVSNRVVFLGNRDDIPQLLNISDIVILSSKVEGFGLAIVEGMAAGKPVIASDILGISEVVENYGLLFEQGNSLELAHIILELMQNNKYYEEIKSKCIIRSQDFSLESMVNRYINVYKNINSL